MSFSSSFLPLRPTRMPMKNEGICIAHTAPPTTKFYSRGNPSGLLYRVLASHNDGTPALELQVIRCVNDPWHGESLLRIPPSRYSNSFILFFPSSQRSNGLTLATRRRSQPSIRATLASNPIYPIIPKPTANCTPWRHFLPSYTAGLLLPWAKP